jgi:NADH-quinone oxidoreductase subunit J
MSLIIFLLVLMLICGLLVILSKNSIHSVLYLVLVFLISVLLFIVVGVEFLALIVLIIYVGAISVLFLFLVMLFDDRLSSLFNVMHHYLPIGFLICFIFFSELVLLIDLNYNSYISNNNQASYWIIFLYNFSNLDLIGQLLFNHFIHFFLIASLILLVSMIGSITLTTNNISSLYDKKVMHVVTNNLINVSFWKINKNHGKAKIY